MRSTTAEGASMKWAQVGARAVLAILAGTFAGAAVHALGGMVGRSLEILPARGIWPAAGAAILYLLVEAFLNSLVGATVTGVVAATRPGAHIVAWGVLWAGFHLWLLWIGPGTAWLLSARVMATLLLLPPLYLGLMLARRLRAEPRAEAADIA